MEIKDLCNWGRPQRVLTRDGPRRLRKARTTDDFWYAWRADKACMKAKGVGCRRVDGGEWVALWWAPVRDLKLPALLSVDAPAPVGKVYRPFQKIGIGHILTRNLILLADEPGLGKTIQTIGAMNADPSLSRVLVVCPANVKYVWEEELAAWGTRDYDVKVVNSGDRLAVGLRPAAVRIFNYDILHRYRSWIDAQVWDMLVVDESQFCKSRTAERTAMVLGTEFVRKAAKPRKDEKKPKRRVVGHYEPIQARKLLFMSGTPIVNRPVELWPMLRRMEPDGIGASFFTFAFRYCGARRTKWGWDFKGARNLEELRGELIRLGMLRRKKCDVLPELPAKQRQVIEVDGTGLKSLLQAEGRAYDSYQAYLESGGTDGDGAAFVDLSRLRQEVGMAKVPHVIRFLREALECGPVVCFAYHHSVIHAIQEELGGEVITGDTPAKARHAAGKRFQDGKSDLLTANIIAGSIGTTYTRSHRGVFAELDWVPGNLTQAEDRLHRIGQTDSVLVQHVVLRDSLDARMVKGIIKKQEVINVGIDGEQS